MRSEVPVFFATTEGQTRRIAERLAERISSHGLTSVPIDLAAPGSALDWTSVRAVVLGASVHGTKHQKIAGDFVTKFAPRLNAIPSAFFSVSMSAASSDLQMAAAAEHLAREFVRVHGWRPTRVESFAGRLSYTKYGWWKRLVLKSIARQQGAPTDTSRDYEFTDWTAVDALADALAALAARAEAVERPRAATATGTKVA